MKILVFNAGSSSLKFELFEVTSTSLRAPTYVGAKQSRKVHDIKSIKEGHFDNHGKPIKDFEKAVKKAVDSLEKSFDKNELLAVGHRVVHGGEKYTKPAKITPAVIKTIRELFELAPLHNPPNLKCILACQKLFPKTPQVAVFDTSFHHTMPEKAYLYGLPFSLAKKLGIRRYGFHGTSHQYVFENARKKLGRTKTRRTITCHLGNGCSLAAIMDGHVIDTSMGFTPLEGIPMGTRGGDMDPGALLRLLKKGFTKKSLAGLLNKKSGLLGVSEISSDMRDIWAAYRKKDKRAIRTLEWFTYRIAKYIGAYTAALGGLDCLVFTGGMGVPAYYIRKKILKYVKKIARPRVLVIPTDEELKIAEETMAVLR